MGGEWRDAKAPQLYAPSRPQNVDLSGSILASCKRMFGWPESGWHAATLAGGAWRRNFGAILTGCPVAWPPMDLWRGDYGDTVTRRVSR